MANIPRDFYNLLREYGALLPSRLLRFPLGIPWPELHNLLLENVLLDQHFTSYPPSVEYQRAFWKAAIDHLEANIPDPLVTKAPSYSTHFWATDPSYLTQNAVDLTLLQNSTLLESRTFIEKGTTGLRTWPASLALAEYLVTQPDIASKTRVLELGSGAGFLGIVVGSIQVLHGDERSSLHLTDVHEEVLSRCEKNVNLPCNTSSQHRDIHYHALDWSNATDSTRRSSLTRLFENINADVILGADLVFDPDLILALVETIAVALQESSSGSSRTKTAILALTVRNQDTFDTFERLTSQYFHLHELPTPRLSMFLGLPEGKESPSEITRNVKMIQLSQKKQGKYSYGQ
ncbi:hypothetical protein NEOLEDRAFT_1159994 [Neolentinus lepideus HHB14362 ss-1]|uniref:FAM86 N-terminal domain-containing protein n=1 Tax=Neolentinus lepideus HHB14362 ss-1 TaxID=1314782 RepID=A0A165WB48_9AGAM|nr:hypothetical protein NEOLEDRAFT_1159994 [Neolentinus lepideus HHB14362 ss-1]